MTWSEDDERLVGEALAHAARAREKNRKVPGTDIVFEAIRDIADIDRRMQVGATRPRSVGFAWQYNHGDLTLDDLADIKKFRDEEIAAGEPFDVVYGVRIEATLKEQERLAAVWRLFRDCLLGKTNDIKIRDWKILFMLGQGRTERDVARMLHISQRRVIDRKKLQCGVIWSKVKRLMPDAKTSRVLQAAA